MTKKTDYDERIQLFTQMYGNEGDPAITLADYMIKAGDVISAIVGDQLGNKAMYQIAESLGFEGSAEMWREAVRDSKNGLFSEWKLGQKLHDLLAYARYGILLSANSDDDTDFIQATIESLLNEVTDFIDNAPPSVWLGELRAKDMEDFVSMAVGRFALDHRNGIDPEALALLGGVSLSRMRGMMTGDNAQFHRDAAKKIPADEALDWLETREEYYASIWRDQRPEELEWDSDQEFGEPVFVPVATGDNSYFHPGLKQRSGYQIGTGENERYVQDFDDALQQLSRMSPPSWRRPSVGTGRFDRVVGSKWIRMNRDELFQ